MKTHADKSPENKSRAVGNEPAQKQGAEESALQFVDLCPEVVAQRKMQLMANNSPRVKQGTHLQVPANDPRLQTEFLKKFTEEVVKELTPLL